MARRPIRSKWLSNCSGAEIQQMNRLRLKMPSMMYEDVICSTAGRDLIRIFFIEEEGKIIGWSSALFPGSGDMFVVREDKTYAPIYTYINRACRGLGLGKRLLRAAYKFVYKELDYHPVVFYWDTPSENFFFSMVEECPKLIIEDARDYWKYFNEGS